MHFVCDFVKQELIWRSTGVFKSQWLLVAGDTVLATLDKRLGRWQRGAVAEAAEGSLVLALERKREGFLRYSEKISIRGSETGPALAFYSGKLFGKAGGTLQFADGRTLRWTSLDRWGKSMAWTDMSNVPLLQFQRNVWKRQVSITIAPAATAIPELSLLAVLACYILYISWARQSAVAAA